MQKAKFNTFSNMESKTIFEILLEYKGKNVKEHTSVCPDRISEVPKLGEKVMITCLFTNI